MTADHPRRKVSHTGRSTTLVTPGRRAAGEIREAFVPLTISMLEGPAFRALSGPAWRVLMALCLEFMHQAGQENGRLVTTHSQLQRNWRISSRDIKAAIDELEAFGFIMVERGERLAGRRGATRFGLTWRPTWDGIAPTYAYKKVTAADIRDFRRSVTDAHGKKAALKAAR